MKATIDIKGISTTSAYVDGDCMSMVNLRKKNGVLKAVTPRGIIETLKDTYDIVFVHHVPNGADNWIGVKHNAAKTHSSIYWQWTIPSYPHNLEETWSRVGGVDLFPLISEIQQIGNTLSVVTSESISYLLWSEGSYKVLGELPEIPVIQFSGLNNTGGGITKSISTAGVTGVNYAERVRALINVAVEETNTTLGMCLHDAHFFRYAFRMFDGTYIKHSSPLLVMPELNILTLKTNTAIQNEDFVFVSGNVTVKAFKALISIDGQIFTGDLSYLSEWKDLIKSIDLFMSPALGISDSNKVKDRYNSSESWTYNGYWSGNSIGEITNLSLNSLKDNSLFYKVRSYPILSDYTSYIRPYRAEAFPSAIYYDDTLTGDKQDDNVLKNLLYQEVLTDDNFTHNKFVGNSSVYNSRLNLFDLKTKLFNGFNLDSFFSIYSYNGVAPSIKSIGEYAVCVDLNDNGTTKKIWCDRMNDYDNPNLSAFFSYPDSRAKKATLYFNGTTHDWYKLIEIDLAPHAFLNLAYYLNSELNPIALLSSGIVDLTVQPDTEFSYNGIVTISEPNKLKVSSLNNPFNFPALNTYLVGNGTILNVASNAIQMSQGQFGQYPLYIFCTDGIFSANVGSGDIVYSNITPVSNEIPISSIICSTPFGVIFIGKRGLFIINGSQVDFLTPQLEQEPLTIDLNMPSNTVVLNIADISLSNDWFRVYLDGVTEIAYDNQNNEIIIINPEKDYNFVYNLDSKEIYQQTEKIDKLVGNVYPELLVMEGLKVKDFKVTTTDKASVSFVTRPFNFGTTEIKKLERTILRARLSGSESIIAMNHCSNDGVNFVPVQGRTFVAGNYRDIDLGLMARNKHRQFVYAFSAKLDEDSQISGIDCEVVQEYGNEKMR